MTWRQTIIHGEGATKAEEARAQKEHEEVIVESQVDKTKKTIDQRAKKRDEAQALTTYDRGEKRRRGHCDAIAMDRAEASVEASVNLMRSIVVEKRIHGIDVPAKLQQVADELEELHACVLFDQQTRW